MRDLDCELGIRDCWGDPQHGGTFNPPQTQQGWFNLNNDPTGGNAVVNPNTTVLNTQQVNSLIKDQTGNSPTQIPTQSAVPSNTNLITIGLIGLGIFLVFKIAQK